MHTHNKPGINVDLAMDIKTNFTWKSSLTTKESDVSLEGPESITDEELEAAFAELEQGPTDGNVLDPEIEDEIEAGKVYDLKEFTRVKNGVVPSAFEEDVQVIVPASGDTNWNINTLLLSKGVSSA